MQTANAAPRDVVSHTVNTPAPAHTRPIGTVGITPAIAASPPPRSVDRPSRRRPAHCPHATPRPAKPSAPATDASRFDVVNTPVASAVRSRRSYNAACSEPGSIPRIANNSARFASKKRTSSACCTPTSHAASIASGIAARAEQRHDPTPPPRIAGPGEYPATPTDAAAAHAPPRVQSSHRALPSTICPTAANAPTPGQRHRPPRQPRPGLHRRRRPQHRHQHRGELHYSHSGRPQRRQNVRGDLPPPSTRGSLSKYATGVVGVRHEINTKATTQTARVLIK